MQRTIYVGNALLAIREKQLYRAEYRTFEEYCQERWGFGKSHVNRLMDAAQVIHNLESNQLVTFPSNEAQARPLASVSPDKQAEVWREAVETAPDGKVTARHVETIVKQHTARSEFKAH